MAQVTKDILLTLKQDIEQKEEDVLKGINPIVMEIEVEIEEIFDRVVQPIIEKILLQPQNVKSQVVVLRFRLNESPTIQDQVHDVLHLERGTCFDCWYMVVSKMTRTEIPKERTLKWRILKTPGAIALRNVVKRRYEERGFQVEVYKDNLHMRWN
jgi:hypothetical protein